MVMGNDLQHSPFDKDKEIKDLKARLELLEDKLSITFVSVSAVMVIGLVFVIVRIIMEMVG